MNDFLIYGKCEACKKNKFFIRKRTFPLPIGLTATSKKKLCTHCHKTFLKLLERDVKIAQ